MDSIRSESSLTNWLSNSLCISRLFNSRYLSICFPSSSSRPRIFTSYLWLLIPFNNRIHFILWVIKICNCLCRLPIIIYLSWHLLVEEFRLSILIYLIFLALSSHKILMQLLILYRLEIIFLNVLHNHLIWIFYKFFII